MTHDIDFETLVAINKEVVELTGDRHEYTEEDERRIRSMLKEVEEVGTTDDPKTAILEKAALLTFKVASGQNFHEGNKRTALVAGLAFLEMNGYTLDFRNPILVEVVDRAGVADATLNEVEDVLKKLIRDV